MHTATDIDTYTRRVDGAKLNLSNEFRYNFKINWPQTWNEIQWKNTLETVAMGNHV